MEKMPPPSLSWDVLQLQDDRTSELLLQILQGNKIFAEVAAEETASILSRDAADAEKLVKGIQTSIKRGVLSADIAVEEITKIETNGLTAEEVATRILKQVGDDVNKGCVLVFQGLSGTGKGTTVAKLKEKIGNKCITWSNGNVFRSLTLLAIKYCEEQKIPFSTSVLTDEVINSCTSKLSFGKVGKDKYDISIKGFGMDTTVGEIKALLMEPNVVKILPSVAELTQGDVIKFASTALSELASAGYTVLLEGREQTVNYVRTPHRFELCIKDVNLLGERRAAQKLMTQLYDTNKDKADKTGDYTKQLLNMVSGLKAVDKKSDCAIFSNGTFKLISACFFTGVYLSVCSEQAQNC